ncbi:hypothetical protein A2482_02345 [Candidatus Falkowbacteria bacterium RIFOXYC2_FULL_48_21]|uniref:N-acetyltransferase domain-containing protein n=1 Tax=Candidatus Falkowbacteria bacterium RIFOXYC2_FULL_48_21 TaxID=1798005 RepID=A0A1F5TG31_9BACT|nr:MAG: hypothetical protein A2482_02345 [Candidatus Falkowbacteria bacterium RIFOXYC2_FULL_48_21]
MRLHKVWLIVREDNERAKFIYQRAGFSVEGTLLDEYFVNDRYYNMLRMAMLDRQFKQWYH